MTTYEKKRADHEKEIAAIEHQIACCFGLAIALIVGGLMALVIMVAK